MLTNRIDRVTIRNFRSIKDLTVDLEDLTVLVGANGSGKSNFLDALHLVSEGLRVGLRENLAKYVIGHLGLHPIDTVVSGSWESHNNEIEIHLNINGRSGVYSFILHSNEKMQYGIQEEVCRFGNHFYEVHDGKVTDSSISQALPEQKSNLTLPLLGGTREFAPVYDFLSQMRFYNIELPQADRKTYSQAGDSLLLEDGANLREALNSLDESMLHEIGEILSKAIPGIQRDNPIFAEMIDKFLYRVTIRHEIGDLLLEQESVGTRWLLAILAALYQKPIPPLTAIEEPDMMLHPPAIPYLADEIIGAAHRGQIIITTHSPDLITRFPAESLRIVEMVDGATQIDPLREGQKTAIQEQLFSGGDLLRIEGLKRG